MRFADFLITTAAVCVFAASPALADEKDKAPSNSSASATMKSPPDFSAMFAMFDKMFPPQPDPDPTRLALARTSVKAMWPDGAYGQMMSSFVGTMYDRAMQMKASDFAAMGGKPGGKPASGAELSLHDSVAGKDPYFDRRVAAFREVITEELGKVSAIIDPRMREGLARAMARKFDAQQLGEINRFFATPAGQKFAGQYMQLWVDPDTIRSIFGSMPEMMKLMPEMMEKLKVANDKFPKPSKAAETNKTAGNTAKPPAKKSK
jgi:hypothetical protein